MWCNMPIETFFPLLKKQFLNSLALMPFRAFAVFVSPLPHWQNVSLWGHFSSRKTNKKFAQSEIRWIGRVQHGGHAVFGQKLLNTQCIVGRCAHTHSSWNRQMRWNTLQKKSRKLNATSHNNASWYTDTDGFLEQSLSGESLSYKCPPSRK